MTGFDLFAFSCAQIINWQGGILWPHCPLPLEQNFTQVALAKFANALGLRKRFLDRKLARETPLPDHLVSHFSLRPATQARGKSRWTPTTWRPTRAATVPTWTSACSTATTPTKCSNGSRRTSTGTTIKTGRRTWCRSTPTGSRSKSWGRACTSLSTGPTNSKYNHLYLFVRGARVVGSRNLKYIKNWS